jgi:hypothetical protein
MPLLVAVVTSLGAWPARAEFADMMARQDDVGEYKAPRLGRSRLLVLPVEVRGNGVPAVPRERLVTFFETKSDAEFRFASYFEAASSGRFQPEVVVAPTVVFDRCPAGLDGDCRERPTSFSALKNSVGLLRTAFARAHAGCWERAAACDAATAIDFWDFDQNGPLQRPDGYVDGVMVVVNIPDLFASLPLAPYNDAGPGDLAEGQGGPFRLDEKRVSLVSTCGVPQAPGARPEYACVAEFLHLLGLADMDQNSLYADAHPEARYAGLPLTPMGDWRRDGSAPMPDAESRYRLGWAQVEVVSGTRTITLEPAARGGHVVKLGQRSETNGEYWLAEARGPVGPFDRDVVDGTDRTGVHGLAVYHVDWSKGPSGEPGTFIKQLVSCLNCDPWRPFVRLVQADGRLDLQRGQPFRPEDDLFRAGALFVPAPSAMPFGPSTTVFGANRYDGTSAGIRIENVRVDPATGRVTADFTAPTVEDACADARCAPGQACEAGNCLAPRETEEPVAPPRPAQPAPAPVQEGWGCHALPATLLALLGLAVRRRPSA